jgi:hypothetical protein
MSKFNLLLLGAFFLLSFSVSKSKYVDYDDFIAVEVGTNPVYSFHFGTVSHIFCAGNDVNGDGILQSEQGDANPSWWTIGKAGNAFKANLMKQFDFQSMPANFKPAVDYQNQIIYLPFKSKISSYQLLTTNLIEENVLEANIQAISIGGTHLLVVDKGTLNEDNEQFENCKLLVFDTKTSTTLQEMPLNNNTIDLVYYLTTEQEIAVAFLSANHETGEDASVMYGILPHAGMPTFETLELDNTVSSFIDFNNSIYISYSDSPEITKLEIDGTVTKLSNGFIPNEFFDKFTLNMTKDSKELILITGDSDIRYIDSLDNVDYISEYDFDKLDEVNRISFWNNEFPIFFNYLERNNNKVYIGKQNTGDILKFNYAKVGKQPSKIVYSKSNDTYNIFCLGQDANFNGEFDAGDEKPSWWTIKGQGSIAITKKVFEFEMGDLKFPTKLAYDSEIDVVYIPHKGRISSYDVLNYTLIEESVAEVDAISVDLAGPHLMFSVRNDGSTDQVEVFDRENSNILQKIDAGENVLEAKYFQNSGAFGIAFLNEGTFGQKDASIMYGQLPHTQTPTLKEVIIGSTGNDIKYSEGTIAAVANGSHQVTLINYETDEVITLPTGTSGFNGPRNLAEVNNALLVTTYDGDIRSLSSVGVSKILKIKNKVEDIFVDFNRQFIMATVINNNDYSPSNEVAYSGQLITSVEDNINETKSEIVVYPNPTTDFIYVRQEQSLNSNIEIYDITGSKVYSQDFTGAVAKVEISNLNLTNGTYIVKLTNELGIKTSKFNVID